MSGWSAGLARVSAWSASHPRRVLLGTLLFSLLAAWSVSRLDLAGSLHDMIGTDSPASEAMARITTDYHTADDLYVIASLEEPHVEGGHAKLSAYAGALTRALAKDGSASSMISHVRYRDEGEFRRVAEELILPSLPYYMTDQGFEAFLDRLTPKGMSTQLRRAEAMLSAPGAGTRAILEQTLRDPLRLAELVDIEALGAGGSGSVGLESGGDAPLLLSNDGDALMIRITGMRPVDDLEFSRSLTDRVRLIAESVEHEGIELEYGGGYAIAATTSRGIRNDLTRTITAAVVLVHLLFLVLYRHVLTPLVVGLTAGIGILLAFGALSISDPVVTPLTAAIGAMLAGLGVDFGVHLLAHYQSQRSSVTDAPGAVRLSVGRVGGAIIASGITTAIGFGSMLVSGVEMLRSFALIGVACLVGCLVSVVLVLPAFLGVSGRLMAHRPPRLEGVGRLLAKRQPVFLLVGGVVFAWQIVLIAWLGWVPQVETDLSTMHPRPNRALEVTESLPARFERAGEYFPVEITAASEAQLTELAHEVNRSLRAEAAREAGVAEVLGLHMLLPEPRAAHEREVRLGQLDPERIHADFRDAVGGSVFRDDALSGYAEVVADLVRAQPPGLEDIRAFPLLSRQLLPDDAGTDSELRSLMIVRLDRPVSDRTVRDAAIEGIRAQLASFPGATLSGTTVIAYDLERATRGELVRLVLAASGLILLCLVVILRRPMLVVLALVPMIAGAITMLAAMLVSGLRLNALNGAAVPLLLGITVDAGVILVAYCASRPRRERVDLGPPVQAVLAAAMTTLIGFGAVGLSSTPAIRSLGLLTVFGVIGSTLGTLLVLVPTLSILWGQSAPKLGRGEA